MSSCVRLVQLSHLLRILLLASVRPQPILVVLIPRLALWPATLPSSTCLPSLSPPFFFMLPEHLG